MREVNVGDEVLYVPGVEHAFKKVTGKPYPWAVGLRKRQQGRGGKAVETVEEMSERDMDEYHRRKGMHAGEELTYLRPSVLWAAVVTAVHEDGSADLDVTYQLAGVILHQLRVGRDETRTKPNTFSAGG